MYGALRKLLICLILLSSAISYGEAPTPPKPSTPPQESSSERAQKAEKDIRGTKEFPLSIELLNTGKSKDETQREAKHEEDKSFNELILNIFTGILAIATASLAIITGFLVCYTKKLWGATNKLVDAANNAEAAYILPHITRHSGFFEGPPLFPRPRIQYGFKNHGKTLAIIRRWRDVTTDMLPPNPIFKEPWEGRQVHYIPVIGDELAGEVWAQIPDGMSAQKALLFMNEGRWLYIVGEVEYEDIFGVARIQGYCLRIMDVTPKGWRVWRDGGVAYNYRRKVN